LADQIATKAAQAKPLKSSPSIPKPGEKIESTKIESDSNQKGLLDEAETTLEQTGNQKVAVIEFDEPSLKSAIMEFIELNKVGPVVGNSLKNSIKLEDEMITVELTNPVEVDGLEKIKSDFLTFVRKRFQNNNIQLQHKVNIEKAAERPYTPKEKFEAMLKENPLLGKLKDTFGLDTDY
jgi:DNA polymerase-3 subunit gamma/tau